ncbi:MAG TPA: ATP-binding protein [Alphaproteobacteria bacterium]|nr:ATP-binding protein [Alphaproteobacteria bacterium]HAJ48539.1 ATP-binding protein [Alphaproteobacteria bacterium]
MTPAKRGSASLATRLTAIAAVWAGLGLVLGGLALSGLFKQSVERTFDRRLEADLNALFARQEAPELKIVAVRPLSDPRFDSAFSGWYWQVTPLERKGGKLVMAPVEPPQPPIEYSDDPPDDTDGLITSRSLWDQRLELPQDLQPADDRSGLTLGPEGKELRYVMRVRTISAPGAAASAAPGAIYAFMVAGDAAEVQADISAFNQTLWWSVSALALGLIGAVVLQVRLGLQPLTQIEAGLTAIREGKTDRLDGTFPAEIAPLAREVNALLAHNQDIVQRARTHVGNLAHFLKTPLSVLANEAGADRSALAEAVMRQTQIMRRQVDHYLARARAAGSNTLISARTDVVPVLSDLSRTLEKIYSDQGIEIELGADQGLAFRGERQDLEEMAANLLDNACKWANTSVKAGVARGNAAGEVVVTVEDDGPGLSPEQREKVLKRGERLDESKPGSGLGLSIVREISGLYGGRVALGQSDMGGLKVELILPGTERA